MAKIAARALALVLVIGCAPAAPVPAVPAVPIAVIAGAEGPTAPSATPVADEARAPDGYVEVEVGGVVMVDGGPAVILVDQTSATALPIFIGGTEALAIDLRSRKEHYERPLTHDLIDKILSELGGSLVKVQIDALRGTTFVGTVFVRNDGRIARIDARPSDAIALALGAGVPIFVAVEVLERAAIKRDDVMPPVRPSPPDASPESI